MYLKKKKIMEIYLGDLGDLMLTKMMLNITGTEL